MQTWLSLHAVACSDGERKRRAFALLQHAHLVARLELERQTQNVSPLVTSRVAPTHKTSSIIIHSKTTGPSTIYRRNRPPGKRKLVSHQTFVSQREDREQAERQRWIAALWPITKVCAGSATLLAVAAGCRATTLRARTFALTRFLGWVKADRGMTFPHDLACFVDFSKLLEDSSCTRLTVIGMRAAVAFLELTADIALHLQRTKSPIFTNLYSRFWRGREQESSPDHLRVLL